MASDTPNRTSNENRVFESPEASPLPTFAARDAHLKVDRQAQAQEPPPSDALDVDESSAGGLVYPDRTGGKP